jgi:hypothetical protein
LKCALPAALVIALLGTGLAFPRSSASQSKQEKAREAAEDAFYADILPYPEKPVEQLIPYIPELKKVKPADDPDELGMILENTGKRVDGFLKHVVDVIAHEQVLQERLSRTGDVLARRTFRCNYLIVCHRDQAPVLFEEFREDTKGNALPQNPVPGFSVTWGFALNCLRFSTPNLSESGFHDFGEGAIDGHKVYVIGFWQKAKDKDNLQTLSASEGSALVRSQGIAWVDQKTYQILQLRTDLLAAPPSIGFGRETTIETFGEIKLPDTPAPLWLPTDVTVYSVIREQVFRNEHHYTDYKRFRVTVKLTP